MLIEFVRFGWRTLLRDRFFSAVNLFGLAVGLASVAFILLWVRDAYARDDFLAERLYRIDTQETQPGQPPVDIAHAPGPLAPALAKDFPQIEAYTRAYRTEVTVVRDARPLNDHLLAADPNFFRLLGLPFVSGSAETALSGTSKVALSRRAALKFFGAENVVGRRLTLMVPAAREFVVSAVFEDLPANSHLDFDIVVPFAGYFGANTDDIMGIPDNWGGAYFHTYVRLRPGADPDAIAAGLPAFVDRSLPAWLTGLIKSAPHDFYKFRLIPVRDVHFDGAELGAMRPPASRTAVLGVSGVAILILLIACVNFANLSMARSTLRTREVALRKVLGARRTQIFGQFLAEAVLVAGLAGLLAMALVELAIPILSPVLGLPKGALADAHLPLALSMFGLVLLTAIGSSLYPSAVISGVRPAMALDRDRARRGGGRVRDLLVVLQFAVSIGLIAVVGIMALQTSYARNADLGFDARNLMILRVPDSERRAEPVRSLTEALARAPGVSGVAVSSAVPTDESEDNLSLRVPFAAKPVQLGTHQIDSRFFDLLGVQPLAGRTESRRSDGTVTPAVLNRAGLRLLNLATPEAAIGRVYQAGETAYEIVGVVPDVHFRSLRDTVRPELYTLAEDAGGVISIRYRPDELPALIAATDRIWAARVPDRAIEREFLDERIAALYARDSRTSLLLTLFAGIAVVLSCLGLLAMTAFTVERRTKEIAIRKVLGAGTPDIVRLLLWQFTRPVILANLIAWPIAFWVARDWLNQFAYRIELPLWPFLLAGLAALLIALLAVGRHTVSVARTSPAFALRRD